MRKLVVYRDHAARRAGASAYPCLVNYEPLKQWGEVDDGCGNFGHIVFATLAELGRHAGTRFDSIEFVGIPIRVGGE